ncbi:MULTISPECIES: 50S ribosomal protein L29 [Helicobacter]|uniref:Large ribosomal subunit protein uL29 n=2 Tax=Helicobacter ganmani TaxID=60246 RepID=A0A3D8IGT3_9HELI|nr:MULTISPECIES: 50S ribosomal protein L29 [Helicobacter]RDU63761.1 50S ribosomal protein L29 [Helicobacter ganmani]
MKYTEINTKTIEELNALLKEKETFLFELNLKLRTMQLTNSSEIRVAKKDIARIKTALNAKRRAQV